MKKKERIFWMAFLIIAIFAALVCAGTFTSYDDDTTLEDTDEFLIYDSGEGSGDELSNITWANLRAQIWADMAAGDLASQSVIMDDLDADGNFTTLTGNWATTGELSGAVPATTKSANYTIAGVYAYGGVIYVTSTCDITAPDDLAAGMAFTVITIGATQVDVDVQSDDKMYLDGTLLDDGDKAVNTSTTGDSIVCTYYSADGWYCMSGSPDGDNWTDGS